MPRRRSPVPAALKRAAKSFETWRRTRTSRKIPDSLWNLAIELAATHGVYRCARALRLDFAELKKRVLARSEMKSTSLAECPTFVEVVPPSTGSECLLELENMRGTKLRMQLRGASSRDLVDLAGALLKAES